MLWEYYVCYFNILYENVYIDTLYGNSKINIVCRNIYIDTLYENI